MKINYKGNDMATLQEEFNQLAEALRDLFYEISKSFGIIWLVKKIPFGELKEWVKERENRD